MNDNSLKKLLKIYERYCQSEYGCAKRSIENNHYNNPTDIIKCGLQRCIGACFLLQEMGVPFKAIDEIYMPYREKFYELF